MANADLLLSLQATRRRKAVASLLLTAAAALLALAGCAPKAEPTATSGYAEKPIKPLGAKKDPVAAGAAVKVE